MFQSISLSRLTSIVKGFLLFHTFVIIFCNAYGQNCSNANISFSNTLANNGCGEPDTAVFQNTSNGSAISGATFYWLSNNVAFDTSSGASAPDTLLLASGSYTIKMVLKTAGNCFDTVSHTFTITPKPIAGFTTATDTICVGNKITFFPNTSNTISGTIYNWNFGDGSSLMNYSDSASHQYSSTGNYTVVYSVINATGCSDIFTKSISVRAGGNPLHYYDDQGIARTYVSWSRCINLISSPDSFSQVFASTDTLLNYTVDYGDGTTASGDTVLPYPNGFLQHVYQNTGVYNLVIIARDIHQCDRTFYGKIINLRVPTVGVGGPNSGIQSGCVPMTTGFFNSSSNVSGNTTFLWDFGDGTTATFDTSNVFDSVYHSYNTSVCNMYITLKASNECGSTQSTWGPINAYTLDQANISGTTSLCYPDTTTTLSIASSFNCYSGVRHYYWDFGDGINTGWSTFPLPQTHQFPDTGTYTVVLIDSNVCGIDSASANVNIYLPPVAEFISDTVCLGDSTSFSDLSTLFAGNGNIISYTWNFGDGQTSGLQNPKHLYSSYGSHNVTLTVESNHNCFDVISHSVYVKESPAVSFIAIPGFSICDSNNLTFNSTINLNTSSVDTFYWDFGDSSYGYILNPTHTFSPNGTYPVKLIVTAINGCSSFDSNNVNVFSSPVADFGSDSICFGAYTSFHDSTTTLNGENIVSRQWDFNSDGVIDKTTKNPSYLFPSFGIYNITLIVTTEFGCKDTLVKTNNVYQNPVVNFSASVYSLCQNDSALFKNTSVAADSFVWNFKDGSNPFSTTSSDSFWHSFATPGNFYVSLKAINYHGCITTDSQIVTTKPAPTGNFVSNVTQGCEPLAVNFTNSSVSADNYFWDFGNGKTSTQTDTNVLFQNNSYSDTNFRVRLIAEKSGCYDTTDHVITVFHKPSSLFTLLPDSGCSPLVVNTNNLSLGADSFYWSCTSGDTSTSQTPVFSFGNYLFQDIVYNLTLYSLTTHNCSDTSQKQIKVKPAPFALFTSNKIQGCDPLQVAFTNHSIIADSFFWDFGDGNISFLQNPSHQFNGTWADTSYVVRLITINNNGCTDSFSKYINLFKKVKAYFNNHDTACVPFSVSFTDSSTNADYHTWDFGDGNSSSSQNPTHSYSTAGTYHVKLIISNQAGCSDTFEIKNAVKANALPTANFNTDKLNGCEPLQVSFTNFSSLADLSYWDFGDGDSSTLTNPKHFYYTPNQDTSYLITLKVFTQDGCSDITTKTINTYKGVTAYFSQVDSGCKPLNVQFADSSSYANNWFWNFGDGNSSTLQNPTYSYSTAGTYSVSLIASNFRCSDTFALQNNIQVFEMPDALFSHPINTGCEPLGINFTNLSIHADSYTWNFGDGSYDSVTTSPIHTYLTPDQDTVYNCKLIALTQHGCMDSISSTITVYKSVTAAFNQNFRGCSPLATQFFDSSQHALFWLWDFGNGVKSVSRNPAYTYTIPGIYHVSLVASNLHCSDTLTRLNTVDVYDVPVSLFSTSIQAGCEPLVVQFNDQSSKADSIYWQFGDGTQSSIGNPLHTFTTPLHDTVYKVWLYAINSKGCLDSISRQINVYKSVTAFFSKTDSGCVPLTAQLNDSSLFANYWLWDFGDGNTSTSRNPSYAYYNPGEYNITLIASNFRCSDTFTIKKSIKTFENPVSLFSTNKIQGCEPLVVQFNDQSYLADQLIWQFGDNSFSNLPDVLHTFHSAYRDTSFLVNLVASTDKGCHDTFSKKIFVFGAVNAKFSEYDSGCVPLPVNYTDLSTNALFWFWDFGDGSASVKQNPAYTYFKPGAYSVRLIASNNYCSDTLVLPKSITAWEVPVSKFITNKDTVIFPNTNFYFTSLSKTSLTHLWLFGDGSQGNSSPIQHSFPDTGYYKAALVVSTDHCSDTSYRTVRVVPPLPLPDFNFWPNDGCIPLTVHFRDSSQYGSAWIWSFGDGSKSLEKNPDYTYTVPGTYNVTLIVSNDIGTTNITKKRVITTFPQPATYFDVAPQIAFLPNANIKLINRTTGAVAYEWYVDNKFFSNQTDPILKYNYPGTHDVTLIALSDMGCKDTITRLNIIRIDSHGMITVPDAFTPGNHDNLNDKFKPLGYGYDKSDYNFVIFNRWGEMIFETNDPDVGWDGTFRGELCESEIYYWLLTVKLFSEGRKRFDGKVHLVR